MNDDEKRKILEQVARGELTPEQAWRTIRDEEDPPEEPTPRDEPDAWSSWVDGLSEHVGAISDWGSRIAEEVAEHVGDWSSGGRARIRIPPLPPLPPMPPMPTVAAVIAGATRTRRRSRDRRGGRSRGEADRLRAMAEQFRERAADARRAGEARGTRESETRIAGIREEAARAREEAERLRADAERAREAGNDREADRLEDRADRLEDRAEQLDERAEQIEERLSENLERFEEAAVNLEERAEEILARASELEDETEDEVSVRRGTKFSRQSVVMTGRANVHESIVETVAVDAAPSIVVDSDAGPVEIVAGPDGSVNVQATKRATSRDAFDRMHVGVERDGDTVRITYRAADWPIVNRSVAFTITAPAASTVEVATAAGSISLKGMRGGANVRTSGGSIASDETQGHLRLRTGGGSIRASSHNGSVEAVTSGGSVRLDGALIGATTVRTAGGAIDVSGIDGGLDAQTSGGTITVNGRLTEFAKLGTAGGAITFTGEATDLDAKTAGGSIAATGTLRGASRFRSGAGSIAAVGIDGSVDAISSSGSVRVAGRLRGECVVEGSSSVEVRLPGDADLRVDASGGSLSNDFGIEIDGRSMHGSIGSGEGGTLRARSRSRVNIAREA